MPEIILNILIGTAGFVITTSLAVIAWFVAGYYKSYNDRLNAVEIKCDERHETVMKKVGNLEIIEKQQDTVIRGNREFLENSIELQNQFLKEKINELKNAVEVGFREIKEQLKR